MADKALFENLADQAAPERPRGKPRLQEPQRNAIALFVNLEASVRSRGTGVGRRRGRDLIEAGLN